MAKLPSVMSRAPGPWRNGGLLPRIGPHTAVPVVREVNLTLIGASTWRMEDDCTGQSIDIRGRTLELLDGRQVRDGWTSSYRYRIR